MKENNLLSEEESLKKRELEIRNELEEILRKKKEIKDKLHEDGMTISKSHDRHVGIYGEKVIHIEPYIKNLSGLTENNDEQHKLWVNNLLGFLRPKYYEKEFQIGDRICDVLIGNLPWELQLSSISFKELESRTFEYLSHNYMRVEWVLPIYGEAYHQRVFWRLCKKFNKTVNLYCWRDYISGINSKLFSFGIKKEHTKHK